MPFAFSLKLMLSVFNQTAHTTNRHLYSELSSSARCFCSQLPSRCYLSRSNRCGFLLLARISSIRTPCYSSHRAPPVFEQCAHESARKLGRVYSSHFSIPRPSRAMNFSSLHIAHHIEFLTRNRSRTFDAHPHMFDVKKLHCIHYSTLYDMSHD